MWLSDLYEQTMTVQPHKRLHETDTINISTKQVLQIIENNYTLFLLMAELGSSNDFIGQ